MSGKFAADSRLASAHLVMPEDCNPLGTLHGGQLLKFAETLGGAVAMRHCSGLVLFKAVKSAQLCAPTHSGDLLHMEAVVSAVGRTSVTVYMDFRRENPRTGETGDVGSAEMVYVGVDESFNPRPVPGLQDAPSSGGEGGE